MNDATSIVGEVLQVLSGLGVVPPWAMYLIALLVAVAIVLMQHYRPGAVILRTLRSWAAHAPGPDPVEHPPAPPMDMPPGGMSVPAPSSTDYTQVRS